MPKRTVDLVQVRIVKDASGKLNLKTGMRRWLDPDLAKRLIEEGSAEVYAPTIHDVETREEILKQNVVS